MIKWIVVVIACTCTFVLKAEDKYGSRINYKIETQSFVILYNNKLDMLANHLARNIENWGAEVFNLSGATPRAKIYVYLVNHNDVINAYSYSNVVILHINSELMHDFHVNWVETTFKHELTHNVNILFDKPHWWNYSIGILERMIYPIWVEEGLATYAETELFNPQYKNGRGVNEDFLSKIRYNYNKGISNYFYYEDASPYEVGWAFFDFYSSTYGKDKLRLAGQKYLANPLIKIIYSPITIYADTANISSIDLYRDYDEYFEKKYKIAENSYIQGEILIKNGFDKQNHIDNILDIKEDNLYYYGYRKSVLNGSSDRGIFSYNLSKKTVKSYVYLNSGADNVVKQDNDVYYSNIDIRNYDGEQYSQAYHYNGDKLLFKTKKLDLQRVHKLISTKEGIFYVMNNQDKQALVKHDGEIVVIPFSANFIFNKLVYDKKSNSIIFDAGRIYDLSVSVYEYNLDTTILRVLVKGREPHVEKDKIYFSNHTENSRYNIYSFNRLTKEVLQLTNTPYGAFNPYYHEGVLYYISYHESGKTIFRLSEDKFVNSKTNIFAGLEITYDLMLNKKELNTSIAEMGNTNVIADLQIVDNNMNLSINPINNSTVNSSGKVDRNSNNINGSPYKKTSISFFNYRLNRIDLIGTMGVSVASLDNTHTIDVARESFDYGIVEDNLSASDLKSGSVRFIYNPNQVADIPMGVFSVVAYKSLSTRHGALIANFTPILYSGYGNVPSIVGDFKLNHNADYKIGGTLLFSNIYKLNITGGYSTQYKRRDNYYHAGFSLYEILSFTYNQGDKTYFNINVDSSGISNLNLWKVTGMDYVLQTTIKRSIPFNIYYGTRDGRIGINEIIIRPSFVHLYAGYNKNPQPSLYNTYHTSYTNLDVFFNGVFQYNTGFSLGVGVSYRYNYNLNTEYSSLTEGFEKKEDVETYMILKLNF